MFGSYPRPFDNWWPEKKSTGSSSGGVVLPPLGDGKTLNYNESPMGSGKEVVTVQLPRNQNVPEGATELDYQRIVVVKPSTTLEELLTFVGETTAKTVITSFATFTDAILSDKIEFRPTVDDSRIFIYHGNPMDNGRIRYSTGKDLSNNSLRHAFFLLEPGKAMSWKVSNFGDTDVVMGVRVVGYVMPI